jgi:hypothetical protein
MNIKYDIKEIERDSKRVVLQESMQYTAIEGYETLSNQYRIIVDTREKAIKDALVGLGWTPPKETK